MCKRIANTNTPTKVLSELNRASSILRDVMNDSFTNILLPMMRLLKLEIKEYLTRNLSRKGKDCKASSNQQLQFLKNME